MPELETKRKPPRFPYVAALLCAACLGAAAWAWMRYSYCWDVTPKDVDRTVSGVARPLQHPMYERYVRVDGNLPIGTWPQGYPPEPHAARHNSIPAIIHDEGAPPARVNVYVSESTMITESDGDGATGRVRVVVLVLDEQSGGDDYFSLILDTTASRFHPVSIAGLVVGAMGVFVFAAALRHWLGERRAWREKTEGITTG